jgi:hypothetical protein
MSDGQIINCAEIHLDERSRAKLATQDHVNGRAVVGRGAISKVPVQRITPTGLPGQVSVEQVGFASHGAIERPQAEPTPVPPQPPEQPPAAPAPPPAQSATPPEQPVYLSPKRIKQKVVLSSSQMGRVTLFVDEVAVSETLVLLAYPTDGSCAIIEPPPDGSEHPITVLVSGRSYECGSYGLSAELRGQLVVALPILRSETK